MNYDNRWKIGENFVVINEEEDFSTNLTENKFNNFILDLKKLYGVSGDNDQVVSNTILLLKSYRDVLHFVSQKCKVGALTEVENAVNSKLAK